MLNSENDYRRMAAAIMRSSRNEKTGEDIDKRRKAINQRLDNTLAKIAKIHRDNEQAFADALYNGDFSEAYQKANDKLKKLSVRMEKLYGELDDLNFV